MNDFFEKIKKQKVQNLPFVMYSKPNSALICGLLQTTNELFKVFDYTEKGFVFASFDKSIKVLIPEEVSERMSVKFSEIEIEDSSVAIDLTDQDAKVAFEKLVDESVKAINNNIFKKVVVSRQEEVVATDFDFVKAFQKLKKYYPSTFTYCFFHPKVGFWMGATPEQLLKSKNNTFETTALAGTQKDTQSSKAILWQKKEKDEQQYVTDYIVKKLKDIVSELIVSEPYSLKAGSIWHIKTDISGILTKNATIKEVVALLHPTPAVCGLPKKKALEFILENENYDRAFYTGFLGELNCNFESDGLSSDLFVNLRCMQISNQKAILYMGCGITKESIPQKEWEESVNKSMTMKRVLRIK